MSWILGYAGPRVPIEVHERVRALDAEVLHVREAEGSYVAAGGLRHTCLTGSARGSLDSAWVIVGLGIQVHDTTSSFVDASGWQERMDHAGPNLSRLDGHYVMVRLRPGRIDAYTDALGTRTLYFAELADGVAFSSRLDWITKLKGDATIDYAAFGSHWLTFNLLTNASLVSGIRRLGPGGHARWENGRLVITHRPWTPNFGERDGRGEAFEQTLSALVCHDAKFEDRPSIGLSGGIDSRLLLAMRFGCGRVATHTFGPAPHPDVQVAGRIAAREELIQYRFDEPVPSVDRCLDLIKSQVSHTPAVSPASSALGLRYYAALRENARCMMDGGMGEACRRQFMNRLLRRGRSALRSGDPALILPYLSVDRANVFDADIQETMNVGAREQIDSLWESLPGRTEIGDENFVDLFAVRSRLPNFFGFEQSRLDEIIPSYMPFAQPSLLQGAFDLPLTLRRNGRLFRKLIHSRRPSLTHFPLVKGVTTYPYALPTLPAIAWVRIKKRLGRSHPDTRRRQFLEVLKPFALDAISSIEVRQYPAYDRGGLDRIVRGYYRGDTRYASQVDWWLSFEIWRRVLGNPSL